MSSSTHEQELVDVERRFWNAMKEKDAAAASALTDDQCVIVGAQGGCPTFLDRFPDWHNLHIACFSSWQVPGCIN